MRRVALAALAAACLVPAATPAEAGSAKKVVNIGDYYFSPAKLTVRKNTIVVWRWPSGGGDGHDVYLTKGPKGVKKFHSDVNFADATFRQRLKVKGRYSIVCTLHPDQMRETITVK
ncbi:MAG: hypothetical protein QOJ07_2637 [Thermoleophilaceae bacterium]|jgi:plastocyanin|nr:hypothetical protein [Thermoleophilaceae bacterium]